MNLKQKLNSHDYLLDYCPVFKNLNAQRIFRYLLEVLVQTKFMKFRAWEKNGGIINRTYFSIFIVNLVELQNI